MIVFGPVPSRRLGRSLGINNIPPKVCSYSCAYCQLGRTLRMQVDRQGFYEPEQVLLAVRQGVERAREASIRIDYLTFVPDGEPTLDVNLGRTIALLRPLGVPIAVISNGSLIWREDVREDLKGADWVSLKVDATSEAAWRKVDRPHGRLQLTAILEGMLAFQDGCEGELVTETMLVSGVNDGEATLREVARFLGQLRPGTAYLSVPTRPPAEAWAHPPGEHTLVQAFQVFDQRVDVNGRRLSVELLVGYEGNAFASTGNVEEDLLSITAVHPMREDAVRALLARAGARWRVVRRLIAQGQLTEVPYAGQRFYVRKLHRSGSQAAG